MIIRDKETIQIPSQDGLRFYFSIIDDSDNSVLPDSVKSFNVYKVIKSIDGSNSDFENMHSFTSNSGKIWDSSYQGFSQSTVGPDGFIRFQAEPELLGGLLHDFSQDHLIVGDEEVPIDSSLIQITSNISGFEIEIDSRGKYETGTECHMAYSKGAVPSEIYALKEGEFIVFANIDNSIITQGFYYGIIEFEVDNQEYASVIEFDAKYSFRNFDKKYGVEFLSKRIPFSFFDGGESMAPSREVMELILEACSLNSNAIESMKDMWDVNNAPDNSLKRIASEMGVVLAGNEPSSWRNQLNEIVAKWKGKGTIKSIRERLEACNAHLDEFIKFYQVVPKNFKTFSHVISPITPFEVLDEELGGKIYKIKLPQAPWIFPSSNFEVKEFVPSFSILEIRKESDTDWTRIQFSNEDFVIAKFLKEDEWIIVFSPYRIIDEGMGVRKKEKSLSFDFEEYSEIRVTYAVSPWGIKSQDFALTSVGIDPRKRRSGYAIVRETDSTTPIFIGLHDGVFSSILSNASTKQEIEVEQGPSPRTGQCVIHYAPSKALLFGGIDLQGTPLGDSWLLDLSDPTEPVWSLYEGDSPSPRSGMAYLETHNGSDRRFLIFGGYGEDQVLGDTWEWDASNEEWVEYEEKSFSIIVQQIDISTNPVISHPFTISMNKVLSDNDEIVIFDPSDRSRGFLKIIIYDQLTLSAEIIDAGGDFVDYEAVASVEAWQGVYACDSFDIATLGKISIEDGPVGEIVNIEVSDPLLFNVSNEYTISDIENISRGSLVIEIISKAGNVVEAEIKSVSGDFTSWYATRIVESWVLTGPHTINLIPFLDGVRRNQILSISNGTNNAKFLITAISDPDVGIQLIDGFIENDTDSFFVEIANETPSPRFAASSCSYARTGGRHAILTGGIASNGENLSDLYMFDHLKGWMPIPHFLNDELGHSGSMVSTSEGVYIASIFSNEVFTSGGFRKIDGIYQADPENINSVSLSTVKLISKLTMPIHSSNGFLTNQSSSKYFFALNQALANSELRRVVDSTCSGDLVITDGTLGPYRSISETKYPQSRFSVSNIKGFGKAYKIEHSGSILNVYGRGVNDIVEFRPENDPVLLQGEQTGEKYWRISPLQSYSETLTMLVPSSMQVGALDANPRVFMQIKMDPNDEFTIDEDNNAFCPLASINECCNLIGQILDHDMNIIGYVKVTGNGLANFCFNNVNDGANIYNISRIQGASYNAGTFRIYLESQSCLPMLVRYRTVQKISSVPPPLGSYTRVDERWHVLSAFPNNTPPTLEAHMSSGEVHRFSYGDFHVLFQKGTEELAVAIRSEDKVSFGGVSKMILKGRLGAVMASNVPPIVHTRHVRVHEINGCICSNNGIGDLFPDEPNVRWEIDGIEDGNLVMKAVPKDFIITANLEDGESIQLNERSFILRKVLNHKINRTSIYIESENSIDNFSSMDIVYKLRNSVGIYSTSRDWIGISNATYPNWLSPNDENFGFYDLNNLLIDEIFEFNEGEVIAKTGLLRSKGFGLDFSFNHIVNDCMVNLQSLPKKPFEPSNLYHAINDNSWKIDGDTTWDSPRLLSVWSNSTPYLEPSLVPKYSLITHLVFRVDSIMSCYFEQGQTIITFPSSSMINGEDPIDLLARVSSQESFGIEEFFDGRFATEDWLDLFILSLPRSDNRTISSLDSYRSWKEGIENGLFDFQQPSPPVNHEARLLKKDSIFAGLICPSIAPTRDRTIFGLKRTQVLYGNVVFNTDEYDGSFQPSEDPCDIEDDFIDTCSCFPSSHVSWSVRIPTRSNVTHEDVSIIMRDGLPANAITVNPAFTYQHDEPVSVCSYSIEMNIETRIEEYTITFNPFIKEDGTEKYHIDWSQILSNEYPPYAEVNVELISNPVDGPFWMLETSKMDDRIAFGSNDEDSGITIGVQSSVAFAIVDNDVLLRGVRRYGESSLLFEEWIGGVPSENPESFSVWNFSMMETNVSVTKTRHTNSVYIDFTPSELSNIKNSQVIFRISPVDIESGDYVEYSASVLNVGNYQGKKAIEINVQDISSSMPILESLGSRTCIMLFKNDDGYMHISDDASTDRLRGSLEKIEVPKNNFDTSGTTPQFKLDKLIFEKCYRVSSDDLEENPALSASIAYDPNSIGVIQEGHLIDFLGSIKTENNTPICHFVVRNGNVKILPRTGVSVVTHTLTSTLFSVQFASSVGKVIMEAWIVCGSSSDYSERETAVLLPRSRSEDIGFSKAIVINGKGKQSDFSISEIVVIRLSNSFIGKSDAKVGDHVFFGTDYVNRYKISSIDKSQSYMYFIMKNPSSIPSGTIPVFAARLAHEAKADVTLVESVRSLIMNTDVLDHMPAGKDTYADVIQSAIFKSIDETPWKFIRAEAGMVGETIIRFDRPVRASYLPMAGDFISWDMDENLATKASKEGGILIRNEIISDGQVIQVQEFS
jgi:hypothetical protein